MIVWAHELASSLTESVSKFLNHPKERALKAMISNVMASPVSVPYFEYDPERVSILRSMLKDLYQFNTIRFHGDVVGFTRELKKQECNWYECALYHLLVGSTPPDSCILFDIEGEYSIERFIRESWAAISFVPRRKRIRIGLNKRK